MTDDFENPQKKLQEALAEMEQVRQENAHQPTSSPSKINNQSSVEQKIALFDLTAEHQGLEDCCFTGP